MQLGNWTNLKRFGCTLISVKVFVEAVTALLLNASNVGLSVVLLFKLLKSYHSLVSTKLELLSFNLSTSVTSIDLSAIPWAKCYAKYCSLYFLRRLLNSVIAALKVSFMPRFLGPYKRTQAR